MVHNMSSPIYKFQPELAAEEDPRKEWGSSFVYYSKQKRFYRKFGAKVRAVREQTGLSQAETAQRAGLNRTYLSQIECGKRQVSLYLAYCLAQALGCNLDSLLAQGEDKDV